MENDAMTSMLALLAGLFCLMAAGLLVGLAVYQMRRPRAAAAPAAPPPALGGRIGPPQGGKPAAKLPSQHDGAYEDEEAPTVIVNQPARPDLGAGKVAKGPAQITTPPSAPARTSGATIIAFDEDDDDE
jgi:hypothetical protein